MNKHALLFGVCAGLLLAAGTASAGTCTAEIESLQKTLSATGTTASADTDLGTGVSQGTNAEIAANQSGASPVPAPNGTDANGGVTASTSPSGSGAGSGIAPGKVEQPNASGGALAANQGAGGIPAETAPLDSDAPQSGGSQAGQTAAAIDPDGAAQSLAKARILAQAGDEAGCMSQVNQAKSQLGQQ
jgi:hypothetical protein